MTPHAPAPAHDQAQRLATLGRVPREVFALLAEAEKPLKAYELLWRLQAKRGQSAPPSTIYRAVSVLVDAGLAHRIESLSAFVICRGSHGAREPIFLVCESCGKAAEIDPGETAQMVTAHIERTGFRVRRLNFVVRGVCSACAQAEQ